MSAQPTYDALSNVLATTTTLPHGVDTQVFCHDDLARLTWAGSSGTPACSGAPTPGDTGSLSGSGTSYSASYVYDVMNRLTSGPLGSYTYGDASHADAATAVGASWTASYDASGNMICRAATSATTCAGTQTGAPLTYDNEGRLSAWQSTPSAPTQSAAYLYDGAGQRVEQVATTNGTATTTSYVGSLEEVTTSGSTTTTTAYYGGIAESVNGALSYLLSDGLDSATASVSTTTGAVIATQLYGPYGAVRYQSGMLPTSKGFTGQRSDAATSGLDYYGARYYDPVAGQFTSADTTLAGGLNRYAYVGGNPETKTDPSGHCPWCIAGAIIGAVVGAGIVYGVQVYNNYQTGASNPWGDNIDWGAVGMGALAGAFVGATMGAGATAVAGVFAAGGSVGTAVSAGAGAAAVYAGYGIAPTVAGAEATDVELDAELGLAGNRAAHATSAPSAPSATDADPQNAPPSSAVWYNRHGQLTNGVYTVDEPGMQPHLPYTEASRLAEPETGLLKSVFLSEIDAHKAVLDAAMYADNQALWDAETGKANVPVTNGPTGVDGQSGWLVNGITVSRTHTNFVHGWPNEVP